MILIPALVFTFSKQSQAPDQTPPKAPPPRTTATSVPPAIPFPKSDTSSPDIPNTPLSVSEAERIALLHQPSLGDAYGALQSAKGRTRSVGAALNPQVVLNGGYNDISSISGAGVAPVEAPGGLSPLGTSPLYAVSGAAGIKQLLFDFNQTRNLVRQSKALEGVAAANLTKAQSDLVFSVKTSFYTLANATRLVDVNVQNVANRQRELDLARARLDEGLGLPSDVVTAETFKAQAILALTTARDAQHQAQVTLLQSMGIDPMTPVAISTESEMPLAQTDAKALLSTAMKSRPEIKAAEKALDATQFGLSAARSLNLPAIYAAISAGDAGNSFPLKENTAALGIGVQFPLFDGGARSGAVTQAKGQVQAALSDLQTAVLNVRSDVTSAYMSLATAEQEVAIADAEVANAKEGVRVAEGRYRAGLGLFLDVTNAQAQLLSALTDQTTVQVSRDLARSKLRHAIGETIP